jgi:hypothetical protein
LRIIDFNVCRFLNSGAVIKGNTLQHNMQKKEDLHNFVAGILYTVFTGRDFRYMNNNRPPVARPSDPTAIDGIFKHVTHLDFGMEETLLPQIPELMNRAADLNSDMTVDKFLDELKECAVILGWDIVGFPMKPLAHARRAREEAIKGLAALSEGQLKVEEARKHFLEAMILNPKDEENKRLYQETSDIYERRVLP